MVDVRPFAGLRYADANRLAALMCPPYDVISPAEQAAYYERDPHNIIRLELGREKPSDGELDNRYTRAAITYAEWRLAGILRQDAPSLYVYEQRFEAAGQSYTRTTLFTAVRLQPWEAGAILPHERTLSKPKSDRLHLTRACATNLSPVMALYDDADGTLAAELRAVQQQQQPLATFTDDAGVAHRFWVVTDEGLARRAATFFADRQLYIADGHHRYETALTYRDETLAARKELLPDDAVNFTLMGLSAIEDEGLLVLPTHRLIRGLEPEWVASLEGVLATHFSVVPLEGDVSVWSAALAEAGRDGVAFVCVSPQGARLLQLREAGRAAMAQASGEDVGVSDAWRGLDVTVLSELVLHRGLGVTPAAVRAGEYVSYRRAADEAADAVLSGREGTQLAFLLNPTPASAICDVARAGDRMPQKSTYFYPKLPTGLVLHALW